MGYRERDASNYSYYVYIFCRGQHNGAKDFYVYERTCGTERAAKERVLELQKRGEEALYLVNHIIKDAFY